MEPTSERKVLPTVMAILYCGALLASVAGLTGGTQPDVSNAQNHVSVTVSGILSASKAIPVTAQAGNDIMIAVPSNHTTGYQWHLGNTPNFRVLKSAGSVYNEPTNPRPGQGSAETWTFHVVGSGMTTIVLEYVRPWEKNTPPARTQTFSVVVK